MAKTNQKKDPQPAPDEAPPSASDAADEEALARLCDVPITLSARLDHKRVKTRAIVDLRVGSIIKLERSAGENVDLLLDGVLVGNGEIVVIEDMMGLRITDLGTGGRRSVSK